MCPSHDSIIEINEINLDFWKDVSPLATKGLYYRGSPDFAKLMHSLRAMGDAYLVNVGTYAARDDKMSEQIHRQSRKMRGARELSWSYASFLSAWAARNGQFINLAGK